MAPAWKSSCLRRPQPWCFSVDKLWSSAMESEPTLHEVSTTSSDTATRSSSTSPQFSDKTSVSTIWPLPSKAGSCSLASALVACQDCALGQHRQDMEARTQCWSIRAQAVHVSDLSRVGIGIGTTSREPSSRRYVIADLTPDDLTPDDTPSQPSWLRNFGVVLFHYCLLCRFHTPGSFDRMV